MSQSVLKILSIFLIGIAFGGDRSSVGHAAQPITSPFSTSSNPVAGQYYQLSFPAGRGIPSLTWTMEPMPVMSQISGSRATSYVALVATFWPEDSEGSENYQIRFDTKLQPGKSLRLAKGKVLTQKIFITSASVDVRVLLEVRPRGRKPSLQSEIIRLERMHPARLDDAISRWTFMTGISPTVASYREDLSNLSLAESALTGKLGATYTLKPQIFSLNLNGYFTLIPFAVSPPANTTARFYGLNLRADFGLSLDPNGDVWKLGVGPYFWSMLVPDQSYGVNDLKGLQVYLLYQHQTRNSRWNSVYLKLAPISDRLSSVALSNSEQAVGGSFQLNDGQRKARFLATWDASRARFYSSDDGNGMRLLTFSVGIGFVW